MPKQFIFIDDSGDPGLSKSATSHFIVAAVLVIEDKNYTNLVTAMNGFRAGLGFGALDELKFQRTRKTIIKRLLKFIQKYEFEAYAAVVDKTKIISCRSWLREKRCIIMSLKSCF